MAIVSATTMVVLAVDVMTGSRLQLSSLMGLQPVVAGRFYGMGNPTFALFATATILLCTAVSSALVLAGRRRAAAVAVAVIGGFAVVVDGMPFWGADGGGPPALVPGLAYLVLAVLGLKLTWKRALLSLVGVVALFFVVAGPTGCGRRPRAATSAGSCRRSSTATRWTSSCARASRTSTSCSATRR